ncbi:MAG: hypothetical protein NW201_08935 [Gemmatimonadales bacterium]|nr:hypothetical protein [Gemmatimonadales bacterium]
MRRFALCALVAALAAAPARAQEAAPPADPERAAVLQQLIEQRFAERVKERLGLNDDQLQRLRQLTGEFGARRRTMEAEERFVKAQLAEQLRPGGTADQKQVQQLQERLLDLKERYLQSFRDEQSRMDFLNPVQRAQFFQMREQLGKRIQELRERRGLDRPGARVGRGRD